MSHESGASGNSERRRRQNAVAQRNYRAKQKARVQRLERLVTAALMLPNDLAEDVDRGALQTSPLDAQPAWPGDPRVNEVDSGKQQSSSLVSSTVDQVRWPDINATVLEFLAFLRQCTPREIETCGIILEREKFGARDVIKFGLISMGCAMDPILFDMARTMPFRPWLELLRITVGSDVDFRRAYWSGLKLLSTFSVPDALSPTYTITHCPDPASPSASSVASISVEPRIPCPALSLSVNISMTRITAPSAMRANAAQLSVDGSLLLDDESISPLYGADPAGLPAHLSLDLRPTPAQLAVPHHPCFDLVPWPEFRELALRAIAGTPPAFDEEDLCLDVLNDGLICWGGTAAGGASSLHGRGQGSPWDGRSWEAAPWFLEKYASLTGGPRGEMCRNSEWWRGIRGEEIL
ncbi:hypothetical protein RB600_002658 [Gaeumannomyces tritici]